MVYGDVATALIHGLREAATLTMTRPPKFDEQRWELEVKTGDMTVRILTPVLGLRPAHQRLSERH